MLRKLLERHGVAYDGRKEIERELIHRMLDGDLGPDEKKCFWTGSSRICV